MENVVTMIGSLGFPIVCCIALAWYVKSEIAALRDVVSKNTEVMHEMLEHFKSEHYNT